MTRAARESEDSSRHDIRYVRSGWVNIAYEVTGSGAVDIVLVPGFVSHLEIDWEDPRSAAFLERLGRIGRLIRLDKRGTGLSDRPPGLADFETRMDDVRAVMDAAGSDQAVLFGYSDGGPIAALFAATYPARTRALVLFGSYAKRTRSADYPWAPTPDERAARARATEADWGVTSSLALMSPSADAAMNQWWQRRAGAAASPGGARLLIETNSKIDVRSVLPAVRAPTLVLHRVDDANVTIENGRFLAEHIPNARLIELPGADHVPWLDADQVLGPVEELVRDIESSGPELVPDRALATILFTDIVDSTRINARVGDARWSLLLDQHDEVVRNAVERRHGRVVKSTGDGVLAVFDTPTRALRAALEAQGALAALGLRIRAGLHASEIETRGDDVAGLGVTIAARLVALADPGEILATAVVRDLSYGSDIEFVARGSEKLKGVPGRWDVIAVDVPDPAGGPAPVPIHGSRRTSNLPTVADAFLGRHADLERLDAALARSQLVTLAGPGGVGKTRLAIEYAAATDLEVRFVDLSRVSDPDDVGRAVLDALGVSARVEISDVERVVEAIDGRALLLLLDNCEHVASAAAELVDHVVCRTTDVWVLATSREALNVTGEYVLVVAPLAIPPEHAPLEEQVDSDAVRMFVERAERAGAVIDDLPAVVALCRRLDGIPLALELAAARMRSFSAREIVEQLDAGVNVAVPRRSHGPAHHLSLDDAIDWSFRLLDDAERDLLLAVSVFRGAFDLAAALAVAARDPSTAVGDLAHLVEKSLVQPTDDGGRRRFRLLETVRAFARARTDPAARERARERHCVHFVEEVQTLGVRIPGADEDEALSRLAADFDDVVEAFDFALGRGDAAAVATLACGPRLALSVDAARWAQLALRAVELDGLEDEPNWISLLASAAWGAVVVGDLGRARSLAEAAMALAGDPAQHPRLCWIWPQATAGSFSEGADGCLAGAAVAAEHRDHAAQSFLLGTAAIYRLAAGDDEVAVVHARAALETARIARSRILQTRAAAALAYALQDLDPEAAWHAAEDVVSLAAPGDFHLSIPHRVFAVLAWRAGDRRRAAAHAAEAAALIRDQGDRYVQATSVQQLAVIVGDVDHEVAAELLGIAESLVPDARLGRRDAVAGERLRADLVASLGTEHFAACFERGRTADGLALNATLARALDLMGAERPNR